MGDERAAVAEALRAVDQEPQTGDLYLAYADAALAAVEAAGWGPRPAPVTAADERVIWDACSAELQKPTNLGMTTVIRTVLSSDVLRRRGIVVAGE